MNSSAAQMGKKNLDLLSANVLCEILANVQVHNCII